MRPIHRIPSSIRVRRTESETNRNNLYSSVDAYNRRSPQPPATASEQPSNRTPSQPDQPSTDYFTLPGTHRGSSSTPGGEPATSLLERTTPNREQPVKVDGADIEANAQDDDEDPDDDEMLRLEMQAARRAIHDEEQCEQRRRRGLPSRSANPPGDYPPIRLSDESLHPQIPSRGTSRRPGAVEGLAMRHHRLHKEERRQKRREQHSSVSTSSSSSSSSPAPQTASDDSTAQGRSENAPIHPPHNRNLSDVQEEQFSRTSTSQFSQSRQADQSTQPDSSNQPEEQNSQRQNRARRNTVADEGFLAQSRRLYDTLTRRRSDNNVTNVDPKQQAKLMRSSRGSDNNNNGRNSFDDNLYISESSESSDMHEDEVVDYLDVVDPEVATVTALQNVGNSIFFPPIPMLYNRRPTISLPSVVANRQAAANNRNTPQYEPQREDIEMGLRPSAGQGSVQQSTDDDGVKRQAFGNIRRVASLVPGRKKKQVPPTTEEERRKHIKEWAEMDEEERNQLDDHVHQLLTKRAKFKRAARGFWRYVKTPHGFIITTYAFLITFWGTAICLFLLRWIDVGNPARQRYWIEICDQILCALFAAVGLGFAPFRAVDTYRMVQIAHYHFLTYKRRRELDLPELKDKNELPRAAPRLNMSQMTNTMMVLTGLRKGPAQVTESGKAPDAEGAAVSDDSNNVSASEPGPRQGGSADSSWEFLDATQSRSSANKVEDLKEKCERRHEHRFFHRQKHHSHEKDDADKADKEKQTTEESGSPAASASPKAKPSKTAHKTYPNKDGIIPLGQLKRNPSIASELPRDAEDIVVLSPKQQANLEYQQRKFHESHTFYRYRETVTHRPFELSLMMAIVILLDCHSCLQASLGGTTWGIYYKNRPTSVTATIITFSLSCNAVAGILIWWGGSRTKKKEEVERLLRIALEEEALRKMRKRQRKLREEERQAEREWAEQGRLLHPNTAIGVVGGGKEAQNAAVGDGTAVSNAAVQQTPALKCIQEH
ncbi:uncharacterized protein UHOD_07699 [Ustilago sp. UG-2017b]|nr:uncharacterized protein UHOD_07699 [Ustilago sp. UG-2017b]